MRSAQAAATGSALVTANVAVEPTAQRLGPPMLPSKLLAAAVRVLKRKRAPLFALCVVLAFSVASKAIDISQPCKAPCSARSHHTLIFDEDYYVNAARVIDGINPPQKMPYHGAPAGDDPNAEHPQLAKLIVAGTIKLFGDTPLGWRIGSIIFAALALLALYALVTGAGGSGWLGVGVCAVMALDNLMLVHGRIATLDIYAVAVALLAAALYVRKHPLLAGLALGVAACMKEVALLLLVVFALFEGLRIARAYLARRQAQPSAVRQSNAAGQSNAIAQATLAADLADAEQLDRTLDPSTDLGRPEAPFGVQPRQAAHPVPAAAYGALSRQTHSPSSAARGPLSALGRAPRTALQTARRHHGRFALFALVGVGSFIALLWLLDVLVPAYDPGTHKLYAGNPFSHIAHMYNYALLLKSKPQETGIASSPLAWLLDAKTINYAKVVVNTLAGGKIIGSHTLISFRGAINPFVILLAIPATFAAIALAFRDSDDVAALGACWCLGTYVPLLIGNLASDRVSYIYYMLIVMPGVYIVTVKLFAGRHMPRAAALGWALALAYGFIHLFPLRTLL